MVVFAVDLAVAGASGTPTVPSGRTSAPGSPDTGDRAEKPQGTSAHADAGVPEVPCAVLVHCRPTWHASGLRTRRRRGLPGVGQLPRDVSPHPFRRRGRQVRRLDAARSGHDMCRPPQFRTAPGACGDVSQGVRVVARVSFSQGEFHQPRGIDVGHGGLLFLGIRRCSCPQQPRSSGVGHEGALSAPARAEVGGGDAIPKSGSRGRGPPPRRRSSADARRGPRHRPPEESAPTVVVPPPPWGLSGGSCRRRGAWRAHLRRCRRLPTAPDPAHLGR